MPENEPENILKIQLPSHRAYPASIWDGNPSLFCASVVKKPRHSKFPDLAHPKTFGHSNISKNMISKPSAIQTFCLQNFVRADNVPSFTAQGMRFCIITFLFVLGSLPTNALDLTRAGVVTEGNSPRVQKAAVMLV